MRGLFSDSQRLGDALPRPALRQRLIYGLAFQVVGETAQRHDGGEGVLAILRVSDVEFSHPSTIVDPLWLSTLVDGWSRWGFLRAGRRRPRCPGGEKTRVHAPTGIKFSRGEVRAKARRHAPRCRKSGRRRRRNPF